MCRNLSSAACCYQPLLPPPKWCRPPPCCYHFPRTTTISRHLRRRARKRAKQRTFDAARRCCSTSACCAAASILTPHHLLSASGLNCQPPVLFFSGLTKTLPERMRVAFCRMVHGAASADYEQVRFAPMPVLCVLSEPECFHSTIFFLGHPRFRCPWLPACRTVVAMHCNAGSAFIPRDGLGARLEARERWGTSGKSDAVLGPRIRGMGERHE